ncbi:MAG: nucleotidyltransferase domain-containing protein [Bacteroidia bacterium]|nr:nucleotidyltransferase domain-containing protein [Bacteroidia bacterium]
MTNPDKILKEVTSIITQYGVEKIILFGSYAYGTPNESSDIDLLVIKNIPANETRDFRITLKKALWVKLGKLDYSFDIIVDNEKRILERINLGDLFYKEIYTKGKTIYA